MGNNNMKYQVFIALVGAASCVNLKREPLLTWAPTPADSGPPKDYFVPHFGEDEEIKGAKVNLAVVEKQMDHKLDLSVESAEPANGDRNYFVPHFGADHDDVVDT